MTHARTRRYSVIQLTILVVLRTVIGWHFLYEGLAKLFISGWSSAGYLELSRWIFSDFFHWIVANPDVLRVVDFLNIWGLIVIGLGLVLGCFSRIAGLAGIVLLLFYYVAHPPLVGMDFGASTEGNYLIVDKNLVEMFALLVLVLFPTGHIIGLDRLINHFRAKGTLYESSAEERTDLGEEKVQVPLSDAGLNRREVLKSLATTPVLGVFVIALLRKMGWESYEERFLAENVDAVTRATIKTFNFSSLQDLKGTIPHAQIRGVDFSRVILGGNLIGGWAHARDLIYVSKLVKSYHSDEKVFETMLLAEKCGINALLTNPMLCRVINEYWRRNIGKMKFISDCGGADLLERVQMSIDNGAGACYVQGETADRLVREGNIDLIGEALELIWKNDMPAGIGGHYLETITGCVDFGLEPDFWMKTLHHNDYWSAQPVEERDNIFCRKPEETIAYMKTLKQPFIAFKTLAAGAIDPAEGLRYAFENGADFVCLGMYDFQIVDDTNIVLDILGGPLNRERPWMA